MKVKGPGHRRGSSHPGAKLTEAKARAVFTLFYDKDWTLTRIAQKFGVNRKTIASILRNEAWTHINQP